MTVPPSFLGASPTRGGNAECKEHAALPSTGFGLPYARGVVGRALDEESETQPLVLMPTLSRNELGNIYSTSLNLRLLN